MTQVSIAKERKKEDIIRIIGNSSIYKFKIIDAPKNCGVAEARNIGISHAIGSYIAYLDDDDFNDLKFEMKQIDSIHEIKDVRHKTDVHPRAIIVMYCLEALKTFTDMPIKAIARLVMEAATLVQSGLDVNNHDKKYKLKTLLDTYSGLNVICLLHTALQQIAPSKDSGFDIQVEYEKALVLFEGYKQYVYEL